MYACALADFQAGDPRAAHVAQRVAVNPKNPRVLLLKSPISRGSRSGDLWRIGPKGRGKMWFASIGLDRGLPAILAVRAEGGNHKMGYLGNPWEAPVRRGIPR